MNSLIIVMVTGLIAGLSAGTIIIFFIATRQHKVPALPQYTTTFVFSGNLKQTGLMEAVRFLELGRRQGILHIYCGRRKGYVTFAQGAVIDAFYRDTTGKEAVFAILQIEEGDFYFEPKTIDQPRVITDTFMDLVIEFDALKESGQLKPVT